MPRSPKNAARVPGELRIGEPAIAVRVRRSAQARRMVLRVGHAGEAGTLTLPPGVPLAAARAFLSDHEGWLRRQLAVRPAGVPVVDGTVLPFRGGSLTVRVAAGRRIHSEPGQLHVPGRPDQLAPRVAAWLREAARDACVAAAERHGATLRRTPARITLRDPRSRWGSCTVAGDLMFSWRLILAPEAVLDYVVAHEMAHLAEMNHSDRFWQVVRRLYPGYEAPRDWLRGNGRSLHIWDFTRPEAA